MSTAQSSVEDQEKASSVEDAPYESKDMSSELAVSKAENDAPDKEEIEVTRFKIPSKTDYQQIHDPKILAFSTVSPAIFQVKERGRENGIVCWFKPADIELFSNSGETGYESTEYSKILLESLRNELGQGTFLLFTRWEKVDEVVESDGTYPVFLAQVLCKPEGKEEMVTLGEWLIEAGLAKVAARTSSPLDSEMDVLEWRKKLVSLQDIAQGQELGGWKAKEGE